MKIINEPKYQDFNGKVHRTEKECINAENNFVGNVFQMFENLAKGCRNQNNSCSCCPFCDNLHMICTIEVKTGDIPANWNFIEEE